MVDVQRFIARVKQAKKRKQERNARRAYHARITLRHAAVAEHIRMYGGDTCIHKVHIHTWCQQCIMVGQEESVESCQVPPRCGPMDPGTEDLLRYSVSDNQ